MSAPRAGRPRHAPGRTVRVSAPARLHLGLLDLEGSLGRRFGSLGLAIDRPRTEVAVEAAAPPAETARAAGAARGARVADVVRLASELAARLPQPEVAALEGRLAELIVRYRVAGLPAPAAIRLTLEAAPPAHSGFGSGTQLALAVGTGISRLAGFALEPSVLAVALRRGRRSGVGIAAFAAGGLILDGGHPRVLGEEADGRVPPVLAQHPLPESWRFVVIVPDGLRGLAGTREAEAFRRVLPSSPERVGEICRRIVLQLLPAAVEGDLESFGAAVTVIQRLVGDEATPVQGGRFASPLVAQAVEALLAAGAAGAGQSSWGPACYGVVGSPEAADRLAEQMRGWLAERGAAGEVLVAACDNQGASISDE